MITLFEDINENTKRVARESPSSATPPVREPRITWAKRFFFWLSAHFHLESRVNLKKDLTLHKDDRVNKVKVDTGQEEYPTFAMTKING